MKINCAALLVLAASLGCVAAVPATADVVVVRAGRMLDVEQGRFLMDRAIRIEDGRIVSVTPWSAGSRSSNRLIDWSAYTVLPGLIDLHTHLVGDTDSADVAAPLSSSAARDALMGVAHARATLNAGFTTVRDVGTYRAFVDVALRNAINARQVEGPRMFVAGAYVTVTHGGGEVNQPPGTVVPDEMRRGVANSADEVRARVREILAGGADMIKVIATGAVLTLGSTPSKPEYTEEEIRAAVDEAAKVGTSVAAHAHGAEGIKNAIRAGVRTIEHGSYLDDEGIALMVKHGTWLVADIYNGDFVEEIGTRDGWSAEILRKNREVTDIQRAAFTKAVKAGVRIGYGTDAGIYPHGQNARQFAYMVKYGMTPLDAIRSATSSAAASLGRSQELGSIAAGKFADMIAIEGDPLADIDRLRRVAAVIKHGQLVHQGGAR